MKKSVLYSPLSGLYLTVLAEAARKEMLMELKATRIRRVYFLGASEKEAMFISYNK